MQSKLDSNKFPAADPMQWLIFSKRWQSGIDPVFSGRLAALAEYMRRKIHISSGYRTTEEQIRSYKRSGGRLVNGIWTGGSGYAARPGSSWHEFGLAIDTNDTWLKALEKDLATAEQRTLMRFGLFKPLTKGNKTTVREDWHIQPIETVGVKDKKSLAVPAYDELKLGSRGDKVKELQQMLNNRGYQIAADGIFGLITEAAVKSFQKAKGLNPTGIVDEKVILELSKT